MAGFVGLAGPYEIRRYTTEAAPLVGSSPAAGAEAWRAADPFSLVGAAPTSLHVLLLHGTSDDVVPSSMSVAFGRALRSAGVDVTVRMVDRADHLSLFTARVATAPVTTWLDGL